MFWFKKFRRKRIASAQFSGQWLITLQKDVAVYNRLNIDDKEELKKHILIFIAEKDFEGCGGFTIDDRAKVIIAANACLLLLHRKTDYYPGLYSILVYPDAFITNRKEYLPAGVIAEGPEVLSGQSWERGTVILSWRDIEHDIKYISDGRNVIIHEFAHQIDHSGGLGDSSTVLKTNASFAEWAQVLHKNYMSLRQAAEENQPSFLDKYGATDPAEFFAVATEFFFEKPREMVQIHPQLYNQLMRFYNLNTLNFT